MLKHNLILSVRNFMRQKTSFLINLGGLSTGLVCVILIWLWVENEMSVDKFHKNDAQLYQVMNNLHSQNILTLDLTPVPLAASLVQEMPEVEYAVSVNDFFSWQTRQGILSAGEIHMEAKGWHAGPDFFNVFSYELLHGDKDRVLAAKNNIVISRELAEKLFDTNDEAVGKVLEWKHPLFDGLFVVSGVFNSLPKTSTAQFDFLISIDIVLDHDRLAKEWTGHYAETFVVLREGTDIDRFNARIGNFLKSKNPRLDNFTLFIQQYSSQYLHGKYENGVVTGGRITYVKLFSMVAIVILLIACINFMNLSTARASLKMKEIGVKKTVGASQTALVGRFFIESLLMTVLSMCIAIPLAALLLPQFNDFTGKHLSLDPTPWNISAITGIIFLTTLISGSYPAFYLSGFNPIAVLKGKLKIASGPLLIRKGLVIFQFALSIIFIVCLLVVNEQIKFTQTLNLGYNRDHIMSFQWKGELYDLWSGLQEGKTNEKFDSFMAEVKDLPGVLNATNMSGNILNRIYGQSGITWTGQEDEKNYVFQSPIVGYDFIETLGIELKEGRAFSREYNDNYSKIILNESAVKLMGLKDPVGKTIQMDAGNEIVGVVKDFHYGSLHDPIQPLILRFEPNGRTVMIKVKAGSEQHAIESLRKLYHTHLPGYSFDFTFMDDDYQALYAAEDRVATLSQYFSIIAIIISCLGLFGLAAFTAERRMKEIGVRKILGSTSMDIVRMLTGEFTRPVMVAIFIALPVSYWVAQNWLASFAERIELSWWYFAVAAAAVLFVAWITVALQTLRAARVNLVQCLKEE